MKQRYDHTDLGDNFFLPLIEKAKELLDLEKIILFGSFARGDASKKSDIDLAFEFNEGNWSEFHWWVEEEFATLREVDLINMRTIGQEILSSIKREGIILYERKSHKINSKL